MPCMQEYGYDVLQDMYNAYTTQHQGNGDCCVQSHLHASQGAYSCMELVFNPEMN